jgi:RNA polymerase sigma factor (sigma-70 family)
MDQRIDTELVALARSGDKSAFGQLIERYQPMAKRIAISMVGNENIARELVQEALLQAYLSLNRLRDDERFKSWLYGIVLNVCRSHVRNQKVDFFSLEALAGGLRLEAVPFSGVMPDPQIAAEERELHRLILAAVNALSPKNRTATLLFYYEQLTLQEIATILGVSVVAVKSRLHKARKQLKEQLWPLVAETDQKTPRVSSIPIRSTEERRQSMVKVTIADVVKLEHGGHIIILLDEGGHQAVPIWIGPFEGEAITAHLLEHSMPLPMTFEFLANLLEAAEATLEEVCVTDLKEDTFYATVKLRSGDMVREVDARPSDAMVLALHLGRPIYATETVLKRAGLDVSAEMSQKPQLGKGLEGIKQEWAYKQQAAKYRPKFFEQTPSEETIRQIQQNRVAFVFDLEKEEKHDKSNSC